MVWLSIKLIEFYRVIAPQSLRNSCLFDPSCSEYAVIALNKYGFVRGWIKSINRISRCKQPNGGVDLP
ncbi:membrane protein insertion efficiency factor YidD [Pokkaliibacter plantistimulans]|uniref:membrane protein insertion efficiency factor YidD n=1 Tax=Pokkaliibacter plantistimulans TaxID=1635171 RepID=UPI000D74308B|nr:membrane protein insertion efficiency factor YidD [Pokkaliibacter plantistimulans]